MSNTDFLLVIPRVDARSDVTLTDTSPGSLVDPALADIRRPLDGMRARSDNYATLAVRINGKALNLTNTSAKGGTSSHTANMLVQSVQYQVQEKSQLAQTFDNDRMFFFGTGLGSLNVSAILIENESFQWLQEFYTNYTNQLSGSKTAERNAHVEFAYEGKVVHGYITNMSFQRSSADLHQANVTFAMTVTKTTFKHELASIAPIPTGLQDNINALSAALSTAEEFTAQRAFSDNETPLIMQIGGVVEQASGLASSSTKQVPLREAYPNEYPYTVSGLSVDIAQEAVAARSVSETLNRAKAVRLPLETDIEREARITRILNETIAARSQERAPDDFDPSDTFLVYVEPVPIASTPYLDAIGRAGAALGYLTASAVVTTGAEMLLESDFVESALDTASRAIGGVSSGVSSALRSTEFGSRVTDKIFGPAAPPSVDKVVFT